MISIYTIQYCDDSVQAEIFTLPKTLQARYAALSRRMMTSGPNLGMPHTKALGDGLFELRLKGAEGIARVFYCTQTGRNIVMLHSFVKKTDKIPPVERKIVEDRLKEIKHADS